MLTALDNTVIITGRDRQRLDKVKALFPDIHTFPCDVRDPLAIRNLFEQVTTKFPELNMLVNNAGEMRKILVLDRKEIADVTREVEINLMGPIRMVQQFLPFLEKKGSLGRSECNFTRCFHDPSHCACIQRHYGRATRLYPGIKGAVKEYQC
ncbi:SDR family NAD(P)-dependent oxidoreductase [Mucilaginibacter sp. PAMB04274]|uniref:SDR family NAD(P)-dependent oxidoreductase n=1 Tax=Mucilaginibacter sp. PAMB04274 TaxID=3138568 RepID=UPI003320542F